MRRFATAIAFVSGFVALGYEIVWARRLADLVGATAQASGLVVGVFFLALAAGAAALGPWVARRGEPWRAYAWLEAGILVAILPAYFGDRISAAIAAPVLLRPGFSLIAKALLAVAFVGPPAFLMGGTLPALGQAVVRAGRLGTDGNVLYGVNTLGGAAGIVATSFALLPALGMHRTFLVLMACSAGLVTAALGAGRRAGTGAGAKVAAGEKAGATAAPATAGALWPVLAFLSGFTVLGLEMLGLHLFSQVLNNSTYTFAAVLLVVIVALAGGALVTQRRTVDAHGAVARLAFVLLGTGLAAAVVPRLFMAVTHGMRPLGGGAPSLAGYVMHAVGGAALVLGPVFVLAGWAFPLVLAGVADRGHAVGARWGRLLGVNAAGALVGLAVAQFVAMSRLGLWFAWTAWSTVALAAGILLVPRATSGRARAAAWGLAAAACVALVATLPSHLPIASLRPGERILAWNAGPDGIAAVLSDEHAERDRRIKWNNTYTLGGLANAAQQRRMGHLALLLHPAPRRTAFIGLATGITASSALLDPGVRRVTAVELSPQVTRLACSGFADANARICQDSRARVVVEDGRLFFLATRDTFDVVVGDLFVPWQAGTATLYTREHFEAVRSRLAPGGLFAQWLPMFQLDAVGFWGIAATFASVFPNAWVVQADFQPSSPAVGLVGWREGTGSPSAASLAARCTELQAMERLREPMLGDPASAATFLVGPVVPALPGPLPLMTLDSPWLGDHAPRVQRARPPLWFIGPPLVAALDAIAQQAPSVDLRTSIDLGRTLFQFCAMEERADPQSARWLDVNLHAQLPPAFFIEQPLRMNWPFTQRPGYALLQRARAQSAP